MLSHLDIQDFVVIDHLSLSVGPGFTAFTGETGAGKSLLLDALLLAVGGRADTDCVRGGAAKTQISTTFSLSSQHPVFDVLASHDLTWDEEGVLVLRRVIARDGKGRAYINDQPVSVGLLKRVAADLLEIHGQFDQLSGGKDYRALLDRYGQVHDTAQAVMDAYTHLVTVQQEHDTLEETHQRALRDQEIDAFHLEELRTVAPEADEEERLLAHRAQAQSIKRLKDALDTVMQYVAHGDWRTVWSQSERALGRLQDTYPDVTQVLESLASAEHHLGLVQEATETLAHRYQDVPDLDAIDERLALLRGLGRKHGVSVDQLVVVQSEITERLAAAEARQAALQRLSRLLEAARAVYHQAAARLSVCRHQAGERLTPDVSSWFEPLKLERAAFRVGVSSDTTRVHPEGYDQVVFEVQTNQGPQDSESQTTSQTWGGVHEIASGGERARILLALKRVLMTPEGPSLVIFDEIDAGVSGHVSTSMGRCLKDLSQHAQVFAITHSPQVASLSDTHVLIEKIFDGTETYTQARVLTSQEREEEIARMLSGADITQEAQAAARRLLFG